MTAICSILWVGRGDGSGCSVVADAPDFDVAWARDAGEALALPLRSFDAILVDAENADVAIDELQRLARVG